MTKTDSPRRHGEKQKPLKHRGTEATEVFRGREAAEELSQALRIGCIGIRGTEEQGICFVAVSKDSFTMILAPPTAPRTSVSSVPLCFKGFCFSPCLRDSVPPCLRGDILVLVAATRCCGDALDFVLAHEYKFDCLVYGKRGEIPPLPRNCDRVELGRWSPPGSNLGRQLESSMTRESGDRPDPNHWAISGCDGKAGRLLIFFALLAETRLLSTLVSAIAMFGLARP